jgi:hypothetical protein
MAVRMMYMLVKQIRGRYYASNVCELTSSRYSYPRPVAGTVSLLDQNVCRPAHVPDME